MGRAGFVLTGGRSTGMRRDKALLPSGPQTLLEQIAAVFRDAAGDAADYHRRVVAKRALHHKLLKMQDFLPAIDTAGWPVGDSGLLRNVNTHEDLPAGESQLIHTKP